MTRTRVLEKEIDLGAPAWPPIPLTPATGPSAFASGTRRIGEERGALLSYHPLIVGELLLVSDEEHVYAYNVRTGQPAFGTAAAIYPAVGDTAIPPTGRNVYPRGTLGVPRFTLSAQGNKLLARIGSQVTGAVPGAAAVSASGQIVCLDLHAEGRLLWNISSPEEGFAFEGAPVCDGTNVYVALRRSEVNPQAHVACYDAETGQPIWRRFICSAQSPARGMFEETTHQLLTLAEGKVYYNTNLGCVAALEASDGEIAWIAQYPRAKVIEPNRPAGRTFRDLTPCVYDQGRVFVAPADGDRIFALDAGSGRALWECRRAEDAVHLLGVAAGRLFASGDRLWWIDTENGQVVHVWPEQGMPRGFGRGLLAGDKVYWPTRDAINVFDQRTGAAVGIMELRKRLPDGQDATGGNLVAGAGHIIIATPTELLGFTPYGRTAKP